MISVDFFVAKKKGKKPESKIEQHFQWKLDGGGRHLVPDPVTGDTQPFQVRFGDIEEKEEVMKLVREAVSYLKYE